MARARLLCSKHYPTFGRDCNAGVGRRCRMPHLADEGLAALTSEYQPKPDMFAAVLERSRATRLSGPARVFAAVFPDAAALDVEPAPPAADSSWKTVMKTAKPFRGFSRRSRLMSHCEEVAGNRVRHHAAPLR
jgi:hypothetical protein